MRTHNRSRSLLAPIAGLTALLAPLAITGCQTAGPAPTDRPADFAMSILVQPADGDPEPMAAPRWARPAFYVLEPDGTLRAEFGPGVTGERLPVIARHLEPAQADLLYDTARSADLLEPDSQGRVRTPLDLSPEHELPEARVVVTVEGRTRYLAIPLHANDGTGARPVIDELATLTWQQ